MQQESFFYPPAAEVPPSDAGLPYANPYQMQPNMGNWPGSFNNPNLGVTNNLYNSGTPLQCDQAAHLLTPVSTAMYGTTSTCSWAHTVPNLMPWVPRPEVSVPDPVKRFSAPFPPDPCTSQTATSWELLHNLGTNSPNPNLHLKRKGDLDFEDASPPKLCITEEKMVARFREMHISNQYTVPVDNSMASSDTPTNCAVNRPVTSLQQLEVMLQESNSSNDLCSKSLILAPELKKLIEPEKILGTFLNKVETPSMALVVWEPPKNRLLKENNSKQENESSLEVMENNNNVVSGQFSTASQQFLSQSSPSDQSQMMVEDTMDT